MYKCTNFCITKLIVNLTKAAQELLMYKQFPCIPYGHYYISRDHSKTVLRLYVEYKAITKLYLQQNTSIMPYQDGHIRISNAPHTLNP